MKRTKIKLSKLRDIGWVEWDPIGLLEPGEPWDNKPFADEYDEYLMLAAGKLREGTHEDEVIRYLIEIERDYIGMGMQNDTIKRAKNVVRAIQASNQIWSESTEKS